MKGALPARGTPRRHASRALLRSLFVVAIARAASGLHHSIAELHSIQGLLTIIVLGECVLSATVAIQSVIGSGESVRTLASLIAGGLLIVYSMWWIYFDRPVHDLLTSLRKAIVWGYGHYFVFASAAAVGDAPPDRTATASPVKSLDASRRREAFWGYV